MLVRGPAITSSIGKGCKSAGHLPLAKKIFEASADIYLSKSTFIIKSPHSIGKLSRVVGDFDCNVCRAVRIATEITDPTSNTELDLKLLL